MEKLAIGVRFIGALFLRHIYVCKLADTYMYRYVSGSQPVDHQHDYTQWHHSRSIISHGLAFPVSDVYFSLKEYSTTFFSSFASLFFTWCIQL